MSRPATESALRRVVPGPVEGDRGAVRTDEGGAALRRGAEGRRAAHVRPRRTEVEFGLHAPLADHAAAHADAPAGPARAAGQQVQGQGAARTVPRAEHGRDGGAPGTDEGTRVRALWKRALSRRYRLEAEVAFPSSWKIFNILMVNLNTNYNIILWLDNS